MNEYRELQDVVMDPSFPEVDLALRRGRHVDREDFAWYTLLVEGQDHLEAFYRRYGCELVHKTDGYFYLLPTGDKLSRRQLSAGDMLVGQALALLYLDPATIERGGRVTHEEVIAQLVVVLGSDALVAAFNPKRRRIDERVAQKTARARVADALRHLATLGFVDVLDDAQLRLRPSLLRFAEPVRGLSEPAEALAKLVADGEVGLVTGDDADADRDEDGDELGADGDDRDDRDDRDDGATDEVRTAGEPIGDDHGDDHEDDGSDGATDEVRTAGRPTGDDHGDGDSDDATDVRTAGRPIGGDDEAEAADATTRKGDAALVLAATASADGGRGDRGDRADRARAEPAAAREPAATTVDARDEGGAAAPAAAARVAKDELAHGEGATAGADRDDVEAARPRPVVAQELLATQRSLFDGGAPAGPLPVEPPRPANQGSLFAIPRHDDDDDDADEDEVP